MSEYDHAEIVIVIRCECIVHSLSLSSYFSFTRSHHRSSRLAFRYLCHSLAPSSLHIVRFSLSFARLPAIQNAFLFDILSALFIAVLITHVCLRYAIVSLFLFLSHVSITLPIRNMNVQQQKERNVAILLLPLLHFTVMSG